MAYLDAVVRNEDNHVVFNGFPDSTREFIQIMIDTEVDLSQFHAIDGETLSFWNLADYMAR